MRRPFWIPEVRDLIGISVIIAMISMLLILLLRPVTVPDNQMTNILIGGFMTATTAVIQFYFGSSKGSVNKDDTISQLAAGATVPSITTTTTEVTKAPEPQPQPVKPPAAQPTQSGVFPLK